MGRREKTQLLVLRFEEENEKLLELNQRCQFAASACLQWLDIRLQLMGATVVSAIAVIALIQHYQHLANPGATFVTVGPVPVLAETCPPTLPCASLPY